MNEYQQRLEEFRHHYFVKYNLKLDDEVLLFYIRVNELQVGLSKEIKDIPRLTFKTSWDYYMHGLGRITIPAILVSIGLIFILFFASKTATQKDVIIIKNGNAFMVIKQKDSSYYLPLKTNP